jgi:hypothetical protein
VEKVLKPKVNFNRDEGDAGDNGERQMLFAFKQET